MVQVQGKAAGSVLVRTPRSSIAFTHPRTVRAGEPYEASVTVLNTGSTVANLVSVSLNRNSVSGAVFEPGQEETIQLGTILPGQSAVAVYRLRSQRTGAVSFESDQQEARLAVRFTMGWMSAAWRSRRTPSACPVLWKCCRPRFWRRPTAS